MAQCSERQRVQAFFDAAVCFFVPFLAASPTGNESIIDIFSIGKTIFICMLGVVTMEIMIITRYWTWWFAFVCVFSYALVYPFVLLFPRFQQSIDTWDLAHFGVGENIMTTPFFWISLISVYSTTFSIRYLERATKWLFRPDDNMIRAELEVPPLFLLCLCRCATSAPPLERLYALLHLFAASVFLL